MGKEGRKVRGLFRRRYKSRMQSKRGGRSHARFERKPLIKAFVLPLIESRRTRLCISAIVVCQLFCKHGEGPISGWTQRA